MSEDYDFMLESINDSKGKEKYNSDTDKDTLDEQKERFKEDTEHRGKLVNWVMYVTNFWLMFVGTIILLDGSILHFNVSDGVIVALLGTSTANVLGLPYIVLKGLFREWKYKPKKNK